MSIGEKGMMVAAKAIAAIGDRPVSHRRRSIQRARDDQKKMMAGQKYVTLIPEGQKAPKTIR